MKKTDIILELIELSVDNADSHAFYLEKLKAHEIDLAHEEALLDNELYDSFIEMGFINRYEYRVRY